LPPTEIPNSWICGSLLKFTALTCNKTKIITQQHEPKCLSKSNNVHSEVWKGKAVPLKAWSGPEGSRKLRFPHFMTTAQEEGGKVVTLTHRLPLPPGNIPGTHFC
jgi:hypothetical protein